MSVGPEIASRVAEIEAQILARTPEWDLEPSLDRITAVCELLGEPQRSIPVIHITGTNGKTSTARMVETLLRAFGLRTGLFTSPHLQSMRERICFDGEPIDEERFIRSYDEVRPIVELVDTRNEIPLSFFEILVAMGYAAFADAPVDVAVIEVGMGGSWDATNVAHGQVAVVTTIALDHERYLGSTPADIAVEKAGIIKAGAVAVLAQQERDVAEVLLARVAEVGATAAREHEEFGVLERVGAVGGQVLSLHGLGGDYHQIYLPLFGEHQARNAACALVAVEAFLGSGGDRLDPATVVEAFAAVTSPGRLEVVRRGPTVVLDAAHNPAGARAAAAGIRDGFSFSRLVGVVAVMGDKDAVGILEQLDDVLDEVVVSQARTPRAMDVDELAAIAVGIFGADRVEVVPGLADAIDTAITLAEEDGDLAGAGVLVTGSVVTVGEARALLRRGRH